MKNGVIEIFSNAGTSFLQELLIGQQRSPMAQMTLSHSCALGGCLTAAAPDVTPECQMPGVWRLGKGRITPHSLSFSFSWGLGVAHSHGASWTSGLSRCDYSKTSPPGMCECAWVFISVRASGPWGKSTLPSLPGQSLHSQLFLTSSSSLSKKIRALFTIATSEWNKIRGPFICFSRINKFSSFFSTALSTWKHDPSENEGP